MGNESSSKHGDGIPPPPRSSDYTSVSLVNMKPTATKKKKKRVTTSDFLIRVLVRGERKLFKRGDLLSDAIIRDACQLPATHPIHFYRWSERDSIVVHPRSATPECGKEVLKRIRTQDNVQCVYLALSPERELDAAEKTPISLTSPYTIYVGMGISVVLDRSAQTTHVGSCIIQYSSAQSEPYARDMLDILFSACEALYDCSHMDVRYTARVRREFRFLPRYVNPVFIDNMCVVDTTTPVPYPTRLLAERLIFKVHRGMAAHVAVSVQERKWTPSTCVNGCSAGDLKEMATTYWDDPDFKSERDSLHVLPRGTGATMAAMDRGRLLPAAAATATAI